MQDDKFKEFSMALCYLYVSRLELSKIRQGIKARYKFFDKGSKAAEELRRKANQIKMAISRLDATACKIVDLTDDMAKQELERIGREEVRTEHAE